MFTAQPTKSVASIASNTRAGKPHWNRAAVHWFIRQRDHINSSWKPCHWATRKGSSSKNRICPSSAVSSTTCPEPEEERGVGSWHTASPLLPPCWVSERHREKEGGAGQTGPSKGWFVKAAQHLQQQRCRRGHGMCKSLSGHQGWRGHCPCPAPPGPALLLGRDLVWQVSQWWHHQQKPRQDISALAGMSLLFFPSKEFCERNPQRTNTIFQEQSQCLCGEAAQLLWETMPRSQGQWLLRSLQHCLLNVRLLNLTVSKRSCNLDKLNYSWIYSQMHNYPFSAKLFCDISELLWLRPFFLWKERCLFIFPVLSIFLFFLTYRAAKTEI